MKVLLYTLLCALVVVALMILGLGIKMMCRKHGDFKRHCSSMDPYIGEKGACVCGKAAQGKCNNRNCQSGRNGRRGGNGFDDNKLIIL